MLVYWDYRRTDLLLPFEQLASRFDWHFVFFSEAGSGPDIPWPSHGWNEHVDPHHLLEAVAPDAVLVSDTGSLQSVALVVAARHRKLPSLLLDHGIKLDYDYYGPAGASGGVVDIPRPMNRRLVQRLRTSRFFFAAYRPNVGPSIRDLGRLFLSVLRSKSDSGFARIQFEERRPETYLLFSKQNRAYYVQRDGATDSQIRYVGNPWLDEIHAALAAPVPAQSSYYLLLDEGNVEAFGVSANAKNAFIARLAETVQGRGADLVVKLHPLDYGRPDLVQATNLRYVDTVDVAPLIRGARGCFAFATTLMLPLVAAGRVKLFRLPGASLQRAVESYGVEMLNPDRFTADEIDSSTTGLDGVQRHAFIERFLHRLDSEATRRVGDRLWEEIDAARRKSP